MTTRIKLRRDTAANWTTSNPILAAGEPGLETDTGKIKYGDGVSRWNVLEHTGGDALTNEGAITVQTGDADRWFVRLRREDSTENPTYTGVVVSSTNYDSLGNAIVAAVLGLSDSGAAIFKFTPAGELVWKKSVGLVNGGIWLESNVVIDADDNIIFVVNPDNSQTKFVTKLNGLTGDIIFSEALLQNENFSVKAIAVDSNGNIIIGGNVWWPDNNNDSAFVAKVNPTATAITWQKTFAVESNYSYITTLEVDFNDNIVVGGYANLDHVVDGNTVQDSIMIVAKISNAGTLSWQKSVALEEFNEGRITDISLDSLGNIYATGTYYVDNPADNANWFGSSNKSNAVVVFKMSTLGAMVWDRRVGPGQCSWVGTSTAVGDDGDLYLYASTYQFKPAGGADNGSSGYWNATLALARYNKTTGAVIWQSYFDNPLAQEVPSWGGFAPWNDDATDLMTVKGDKILIGGSVRLGQSDQDLNSPWGQGGDYFNQGFLAQFDTAATHWSAEGWTLETSRIPGKLTNTLVATDSGLALQEGAGVSMGFDGSAGIDTLAVGVSVRRTASKINTWTFGKDGTFSAPADANIKLNQKQLGYAGLYGRLDNDNDDIWFESVTHDADGFAYVLGSNYWSEQKAHIYKFSPEGTKVWETQLHSGSGASFYVEWSGGTYTYISVSNGGEGYKVGDKIVLPGGNLGGQDGVNSLTLEVTAINANSDYIGGVSAVNIISGVSTGSSDATVSDPYDDAECEVRSMSFDPVTGNPVVVISTPTYNGDTMDNSWTEVVLLLIDSGSGAVLSTTTLSDEGDIYAYDIDVSSTGKAAVVGQKYNEYNEYGAITPLTGSGVDKFWVAKSDIDAEHYPGEPNGNTYDWWITGTGITDQAQVQSVNTYTGLTGTVRQGSGAEFTVQVNSSSGGTITAFSVEQAWPMRINIFFANDNDRTTASAATSFIVYDFAGDGWQIDVTGTPTPTNLGAGYEYGLRYDPGNATATQTGTTGTQYTTTIAAAPTLSYSVIVTANGSNYLAGHKVKVLGSALGGVDTTNDITITVDAVNSGAITSVSNTGTPSVSAVGPYTSVAYANYNTGSGADFNVTFDATIGNITNSGIWSNAGQNYVAGDVITIPGTQFAGGATPDNDITVTVNSVGGSGDLQNPLTFSGTPALTHLLLSTDVGVDFAPGENSFAIKQNLGGEAFIWTEDFNKAIGGNNSDWFSGVVWNADGTSVYAVGTGRYDVSYDQALVVKYSSTGTLQASKFVNDDMSNNNAYSGAVALMADDSIVVVHEQYNPYRDQTNEILVTKLDSDLNIVWQQFIGVNDGDGSWRSPEGRISVAVDPASDEILIAWSATDYTDIINDDAIHLLKLDTDGEVLWKRIYGIHESDSYVSWSGSANKFLSIQGDKFTLVGYTQGPSNMSDNAFIVTLPLDGTGVGLHGFWTYEEPTDDKIKVWRLSSRTSTTFAPNVHSGAITATSNVKYYYTDYPIEEFTFYPEVIRSNEGGAIEFADGSKQTFSTALVPQVRTSEGRYVIRPEDSGRHILVVDQNYSIRIPNWQKVTLPVGFTFTIVNISNNSVDVETEYSNNYQGELWISGGDDKTNVIGINDNGSGQMVSLIKIKEGTFSDDGENHGDIWMIAGADIYNNN